MTERDLYPGYNVMRKRARHSWNDATRAVIDAWLAIEDRPNFFSPEAWDTLNAICDRGSSRNRLPGHASRLQLILTGISSRAISPAFVISTSLRVRSPGRWGFRRLRTRLTTFITANSRFCSLISRTPY